MASQYWSRTDAADSSDANVDRRSRRRLIIMAVSAVFLIAFVVAVIVVSTPKPDSQPSPAQAAQGDFNPSVKIACQNSPYPAMCFGTVGNATRNISSIDPTTILDVSIQVAMDGLGMASTFIQDLGANMTLDKLQAAALADCKKLVLLAISQLNNTLTHDDLTSPHALDDLKTWLSSAITMQDVCVDGFRNASLTLQELVDGALNNTKEMSSNSLAILSGISRFLQGLKLSRKLLTDGPLDGYPYWVSRQARKLLEDGGSPVKPNIVVAEDGSGDYTKVTDAIAAVPLESNEPTVIYVKSGTYTENIWLGDNKWNVVLVGDGMDQTTISFNLSFADGVPTFSTATFGVLGKGFIAKDIAFENTAGPGKQQAVALASTSDEAVFYRVRFDGYQDTLYAVSGRQFFRECTIIGTIDFIFGNAAAVFQDCTIAVRAPLGGSQDTVTAQGKSDPNMNTGFSIHNCKVVPAAGANLTSVAVYLGRPWKNYATAVFMKTTLDGVVNPAGWLPWNGTGTPFQDTIYLGEFENTGPGAATAGRVQAKGIHTELTAKEAAMFTVGSLLGGDSWLPNTGVPYKLDL